jgi:hypothetical protein
VFAAHIVAESRWRLRLRSKQETFQQRILNAPKPQFRSRWTTPSRNLIFPYDTILDAGVRMTPYAALFSSVLTMLGAVLSGKKNRSNCQSCTIDGEQCKRTVSVGQRFCFQHLHGWRAKLRAISRNPSAAFCLSVLSLAITIATSVGNHYPSVATGAQSRRLAETLRTQDSVKVSVTRKNLNPTVVTGPPSPPVISVTSY